jgi:hypothetical protein
MNITEIAAQPHFPLKSHPLGIVVQSSQIGRECCLIVEKQDISQAQDDEVGCSIEQLVATNP